MKQGDFRPGFPQPAHGRRSNKPGTANQKYAHSVLPSFACNVKPIRYIPEPGGDNS
jgi:hypothetical protein